MRIALIIGTRPEIIKCAILANRLREILGKDFQLWDTGQHYDYNMDEVFYNEMNIIKSDKNFDVKSGTLSEQMGRIIFHVEENLTKFKPNLVLVVGDTNSTFGSAFMAKRCGYKLAHIEAGPREYFVNYVDNKPMFFKTKAMLSMAENLNRILIDNMSDILFAPTPMSYDNLVREKLYGEKIFSGDIQDDVLLKFLPKINKMSFPIETFRDFNLVTLHRAENTDFKLNLIRIMNAFIESGEPIIFPMHPRTRKKLEEINKLDDVLKADNIKVCEPMGFFDFTNALIHCKKVFTDSGGVQKEAYLLNKPCVTLRVCSGWTDIVCSGANRVVGSSKKLILEELHSTPKFVSTQENIYGKG